MKRWVKTLQLLNLVPPTQIYMPLRPDLLMKVTQVYHIKEDSFFEHI